MIRQLSTIYAALFAILFFSTGAVAAIQCYQCHGTSGPADYRPLDATYRNISTGGFPGNHRTHIGIGATPANCNPCHGNGVDVSTYLSRHRNGRIEMVANINNSPKAGGAVYSKGVFFNQTSVPITGTCSNVNCHFESTTPTWGSTAFASPNDCNKCHGLPPNGGVTGAAGSHAKHDTYYSGITNCQKCHSNNTTFAHATSAGKRSLNVSFAAAPNNGSGAYSGALNDYLPSQNNTFGKCTATYCHSTGSRGFAPYTSNGTATWGGTLTCKGCHKADYASGDPIATGSHKAHINGQGLAFTLIKCVTCHAATATAGMTIANTANHVNAQVTIAFDNTSSAKSGSYNGNPATPASPSVKAPGSAYSSCSLVYCHSTGQHSDGTPLVSTDYQTPTWNTPASGQCGTCHGIQFKHDANGFAIGTPTPLTTGSHSKHLTFKYGITGSEICAACHSYQTTGWSPTFCSSTVCHSSMPQKHANYEINVGIPDYFGASAAYNAASLTPGTGYSTCSNVYCHSDGKATPTTYATPTWGNVASGACGTCHGVTAANTPASIPHAKHVGSANPYLFACAECHSGKVKVTASSVFAPTSTNTTTHVNKSRDVAFDSTNPFGTYSSAVTTCRNLYCHSTGNLNITASKLPAAYNGNVYARQGWTGSVSCNSCHGRSTPGSGATYGMPDYTNGGSFGSISANSHAKHVSSSGIRCVECHEKTTKSNTSIRSTTPSYHTNGGRNVYFNLSGANKNGSYNGTVGQKKCSSTYCHGTNPSVSWGASTVCNSCHGATFTSFSSASKKGAHAQHIETDTNTPTSYTGSGLGNLSADGTKYQFGCASCHNPAQAGHANAVANSGGGAAEVYFGYTSAVMKGTYAPGTLQAGTDNGFKWTNGAGCNATYCHSNGIGSNGSYNVNWATPNGTLGCTGCHGGNAASGSVIATGKHRNHVDPSLNTSLGLGNGFGCVQCHAKTVSNDTSIGNKVNHINKFKDYSGALAYGPSHYSTSAKQCSNIYCHSNGNPGALVFVAMTSSKLWTGSATLGCNGCHGRSNPATGAPDYPNGGVGSTTANNHATHVTKLNITDSTGCSACHRRTVDAGTANKMRNYSTLHLTGGPNVVFNTARAGASASFASGTCTSVTCHSNGRGTYQSPQWGQTDNCGFCHPIASLGGAHAKHLDLTQTPIFYSFTANRSSGDDVTGKYNFGCSNCHPLANGSHTNGTIVIDFRPAVAGVSTLRSKNSTTVTASGAVGTVNSGTSGTSGTSVVCANIYCHSNGYALNMVYATTPNWYGGSFTDRCASCHGNSPNSTITGSPAHYNTNFVGTGVSNGHVVGIHSDDVYTGASGLATVGTGATNSHGNSAYSTTINCNLCHNLTVTSARNDSNGVCKTCHVSGNAVGAAFGNNAAIANKALHVSGQPNVTFAAVVVKSKAEVRVDSATVQPYKTTWKRVGTYKASGSYDQAVNALNTASMWNQATKTCSNISCHNGQPVTWTSTGGVTSCQSCHPAL